MLYKADAETHLKHADTTQIAICSHTDKLIPRFYLSTQYIHNHKSLIQEEYVVFEDTL